MREDKLLLFEFFTIAAILISGQRVLANEGIKTVEQNGESKNWIEEIRTKKDKIQDERLLEALQS